MKKNKGHTIDWDQAVFLDKEKHWRGRKVKEGLYTNAQNPTKEINREKAMNLEKGFALDPIWGVSNAEKENYVKKDEKSGLRYCIVVFSISRKARTGVIALRVWQSSFSLMEPD